ncbi:stage V sporulation protein AE [Natranaerovirga pectinivora]|uniref:Stage V sporulation protein AE n=2 Tax=Natranaerovirga pectinivora TaxID=682400 RepID=A0A4R3MKE3_9FIRM|nr:stage V sporulation protein AE [Natranaerovirga pectinivora]
MDIMEYVWAFVIGGLLCVIAQILMDTTKLMPARILVIYVSLGVILEGLNIYQPLVDFAGAGAKVPIIGFGYALGKGVIKAVDEQDILGIFTGGLSATAGGVGAAIVFGYLAAVIFNPKANT